MTATEISLILSPYDGQVKGIKLSESTVDSQ